ncbi:hypothetical protein MKX01_014993 [Papaver californicum]|nr:hypothetical protein MKX01_014993 [Papaver californicum]
MDCEWRLTPTEMNLSIALSLSGSTPDQILTHIKKENSENYSITPLCNMEQEIRRNGCRDYVWALTKLNDLYSISYLLSLFITDDDQQLQKGIAKVFPEATNFLCAFHIKRNVCANFKTSMNKDIPEDLEKIKGDWDVVWMSESYTNHIKHFVNRMKNRVEDEHDILKRFLKCSKGIFLKCWGIKFHASFGRSKNIGLHEHRRSPCIKHLVNHVSRTALDFISKEIKSLIKNILDIVNIWLAIPMGFLVPVKYLNVIAWVKHFSWIALKNTGRNSR